MLSGLLFHFGTKKKPATPSPTIERTHWYVTQPLHAVRFEDKQWGLQWCEKNKLASTVLKERTRHVDKEQAAAQFNTLNNRLMHIHTDGTFPDFSEETPAAHLDNFFTAFKKQPQINKTAQLLCMAFSVNRTDVAEYIGTILEKDICHWIEPLPMPAYADPDVAISQNRAFMDGLKTMLLHPTQMQWFFEQNPTLFQTLNTRSNFAKLEQEVFGMNTTHCFMWPLVAHTVFAQNINPVKEACPFYWTLTSHDALNTIMLSFAHDPAAQCTLLVCAQSMQWFCKDATMHESMTSASPFISPTASVFKKVLQKKSLTGTGIDAAEINNIRLLELGLDAQTTPASFYQHAQCVLAPPASITMDLPDMW